MAIADDETTRLAGEGMMKAGSHDRISLRGTVLVFFAALAVFSLASVCARSIFPRGVKGRAASSKGEHQLGELAISPSAGLNKYEDGHGVLSSPQLASSPALQQEQDGEEEMFHSLSPGMRVPPERRNNSCHQLRLVSCGFRLSSCCCCSHDVQNMKY